MYLEKPKRFTIWNRGSIHFSRNLRWLGAKLKFQDRGSTSKRLIQTQIRWVASQIQIKYTHAVTYLKQYLYNKLLCSIYLRFTAANALSFASVWIPKLIVVWLG
jgi:hypothetical protein